MPTYIDVFLSPIRDNQVAQTLTVGLFILAANVIRVWDIHSDTLMK